MNKKIILPGLIIILFFLFLFLAIQQYRSQRAAILETVPLVPSPTPSLSFPAGTTPSPIPGVPQQTNIPNAIKNIPNEISLAEKNKLSEVLPIRVDDFPTSQNLKTSINIYDFPYDPASVIRIEIYGLNYNNPNLSGPDALAFRDSFLEVKRLLAPYSVNLKNLQIIFGNRQYIQSTASSWVQSFGLLN